VATDLTGDEYLEAMADLYTAGVRASRASLTMARDIHKGRRRGAGVAFRAVSDAYRAAWEAIETHLREHPQPVQFCHDGWRWTIPSAGRGMICVPINTREEVTA
jgi:formylmethanofuran:tetrahydromethanopterin formyltransferase